MLKKRFGKSSAKAPTSQAAPADNPRNQDEQLHKLQRQLDAALLDNDSLLAETLSLKASAKASDTLVAALMANTADRFMLVDEKGICRHISRPLARILRIPEQGAVGREFEALMEFEPPKDDDRLRARPLGQFPQLVIEQDSDTPMQCDAKLVISEDTVAIRLIGISPRIKDLPQRLALIRLQLTDASEVGFAEDLLTGLPARESMLRRIDGLRQVANDENQSHCVLLASIDSYQRTLDEHGYRAGEQLLRTAAAVIQQAIAPLGEAYRLSLSVFGIVVPFGNAGFGSDVAKRMIDAIGAAEFSYQGRHDEIEISVGQTSIRPTTPGALATLLEAEVARVEARKSGQNLVVADPDSEAVDTTSLRRFRVDATNPVATAQWLRDRLENGAGHLASQLIVPLSSSSTLPKHLEVFVRLEDEHGEWLSPHKYLPAIRKMQMSAELDNWVVGALIDKLAQEPWLVEGGGSAFANINGSSILDPGFAEGIKKMLRQRDVDPASLGLEIDEFYVSSHLDATKRFIDTLKPLGVSFALDQCRPGIGLSSLRFLEFDYIKLHGTVVRRAAVDPLDRMSLKWFNEVASITTRKTIATGVETADMVKVVTDIGIDYGQGVAINKLGPLIA